MDGTVIKALIGFIVRSLEGRLTFESLASVLFGLGILIAYEDRDKAWIGVIFVVCGLIAIVYGSLFVIKQRESREQLKLTGKLNYLPELTKRIEEQLVKRDEVLERIEEQVLSGKDTL